MPLTTLSGAVFLVVPRALPQPRLLHDHQASRYQRLQSRVPSLSHSRFDSANWILMSSNSYTRSGQPLFYLSESEESSETQSSDSSETETDDDGSDAMDTDNDPSLYEFNPTDSDREQFHKPDPFPPREKFPYPEAHTQREQPFNSPRASSPPTASSSGSSSGPQPSPSRPQPNLTYRGSTSHASNTVPTPPPPPPPAEPSSNLNLVSSDNGAQSGDICKPESWVYVQRAQGFFKTLGEGHKLQPIAFQRLWEHVTRRPDLWLPNKDMCRKHTDVSNPCRENIFIGLVYYLIGVFWPEDQAWEGSDVVQISFLFGGVYAMCTIVPLESLGQLSVFECEREPQPNASSQFPSEKAQSELALPQPLCHFVSVLLNMVVLHMRVDRFGSNFFAFLLQFPAM
ncbi:hypothetical protein R3P38DRAFT_2807929 [Favolaschia claudopus]|uniref:Uncharacterized protein n=1 Tax=Favolaschia claudopus TaxID=2862362 RepID=A0AAV9ZH45_9AGAR